MALIGTAINDGAAPTYIIYFYPLNLNNLDVTTVFLCIVPVRKHIFGNLDDSGAGGRTMQDVC